MTEYYLAPLNKLGNLAFRELALIGGADYVFSEMVKVDDLLTGDEVQLKKITIPKQQQEKTIIQISCEDINLIEKGVDFIVRTNSKIKEINYNMGCPQSSLCQREVGGGILKNQEKIKQVCNLLQKSCKKYNITPSVKVRIGMTRDKINIIENVQIIKEQKIKKIYIHGRVLRDSYVRKATHNEIGKVVDKFKDLEIIGNGDIKDLESQNKMIKTKCKGILIGRAALENPFIFENLRNNIEENNKSGVDIMQRKDMIIKYLGFAKTYNLTISHIKANIAYMTKGVIGGSDFRDKINNIDNLDEIVEIIDIK